MTIPPFKLERFFARHEFTAKYHLCASDCEALSISELLAFEPGAEQQLRSVWLGYTESRGGPSLRQAISEIYESVLPDDVLVHAGAEEAIFTFMHATLTAGDHAIIHWPCYQALAEIPRSIGCDVTLWRAREENGWALDFDELRKAIRSNTRLIVLNTPHNPTGYLMPHADFLDLLKIADERGIVVLSDEVYRESEHDPADRLPAASDISKSAVSLGVMSKSYGLPGLRIGWVATHNRAVYERMEQVKDYTTICSSAPSEFLAEVALRHRDRIVARNRDIIRTNVALLEEFFARHSGRFAWVRPIAGPIAYPRLIGEGIESFCSRLLASTGVLLLPGSVYDDAGNHFRIGFGRANMPEALERVEHFMNGAVN